jgi:hypothetical protein
MVRKYGSIPGSKRSTGLHASIGKTDIINDSKLCPPKPKIMVSYRKTLNMKFPKDDNGKNKVQDWTFIDKTL